MIYTIKHLVGSKNAQVSTTIVVDGVYRPTWVRAVPLPWYPGLWDRFRDAWFVFWSNDLYRVVAVRYPKAGELEQALHE